MFTPMVHTFYSLMRGAASPEDICRDAREKGYASLALIDTDNLYGLWRFLRGCKQNGLRPLVGAALSGGRGKTRAVCLAKNQTGFANLCALLSEKNRRPDFDLAASLKRHGRGLTVLAAEDGLLQSLHGRVPDLFAALPERLEQGSRELRQSARALGIPLAATGESWFIGPKGHRLHLLLRAIAQNTGLSRLDPAEAVSPLAWLAGPEEYARRFSALPEALATNRCLTGGIDFIPRPETVMPPWEGAGDRGPDEVLREKAYAGAGRRYGPDLPRPVVERLEKELGIIAQKNFSSYFLVVDQIVKLSPRICGRGSGAASLVAYSLGITNVCPIKFRLYFERFINPDRVDPPDIDLDFAWDERDRVIDTVLERYQGRAAMASTHVLFRGRMAIREVAKVFGLPEEETRRVMRRLPWLRGPAEGHTGLYPKRQALPPGARCGLPMPWPEILELAQAILKFPRQVSVHVGGVVLTPGPISRHAPLETAPKGVPVIQWEKDGAEESGLVKIDLLGNRSLAVIRDALAEVKQNGHHLDEARWEPEDDPLTQSMVAKGLTMGCFYIESPATRLLQQKAGKGDYEHMVIHSSIIRPAANPYIQEYLKRLRGEPWEHIHPLLAGILEETYGIMVYQEQVSQAAVALAGFTPAEGDRLRKAMTWKDKDRALEDYREKFEAEAGKRGVGKEAVARIWEMMMSFAGYSFCKPHSASYARVSFQAAYLKAHFPAEFMAAVISNQGGFYSTFAYVSEARRLGLQILPPDVNQSGAKWSGRGRELRVGLMAVRDLGPAGRERLLAARAQRPFSGLGDFLERARPDEKEARSLIMAGACDSLAGAGGLPGRLWQLARHLRGRKQARAADGLFAPPDPEPPTLPPESPRERLRREYRSLGFLTGMHPMELFSGQLAGRGLIKAGELPRHAGKNVRLAGWLITGKTVATSSNQPMEFLTFEDETGLLEATLFPEAYSRFLRMKDWNRPYLLSGLAEDNFGAVTLTVNSASPLERAAAENPFQPAASWDSLSAEAPEK